MRGAGPVLAVAILAAAGLPLPDARADEARGPAVADRRADGSSRPGEADRRADGSSRPGETDAGADEPSSAPTVEDLDEPAHVLFVTVRTHGDAGAVFCALWPDAEGYPVDRTRATHEGVDRSIRAGRARIRFEAVADGEHAVACFHDENDNGTLDTGWLGIPSEGTGASNDARGLMGPPPWDGARFRIEAGRPSALDVELAY